jgi:DNA-directed RNA polymerase specialized sigma subunit
MDKQTLTRDIKQEIGCWPTTSEIARYLGKSRDYVREMMAGADALVSNRRKQYMAGDVAERIMERRR